MLVHQCWQCSKSRPTNKLVTAVRQIERKRQGKSRREYQVGEWDGRGRSKGEERRDGERVAPREATYNGAEKMAALLKEESIVS